jgi:hypothetical protein
MNRGGCCLPQCGDGHAPAQEIAPRTAAGSVWPATAGSTPARAMEPVRSGVGGLVPTRPRCSIHLECAQSGTSTRMGVSAIAKVSGGGRDGEKSLRRTRLFLHISTTGRAAKRDRYRPLAQKRLH